MQVLLLFMLEKMQKRFGILAMCSELNSDFFRALVPLFFFKILPIS